LILNFPEYNIGFPCLYSSIVWFLERSIVPSYGTTEPEQDDSLAAAGNDSPEEADNMGEMP
jgi:hypothetical protein